MKTITIEIPDEVYNALYAQCLQRGVPFPDFCKAVFAAGLVNRLGKKIKP